MCTVRYDKTWFSLTMAKLCSQNIVLYRIYLEQESAQYWFSIGGTNFINQNYHLIDDAIDRFSANRLYAIARFSSYRLYAGARFSVLYSNYAVARRFRSRHIHGSLLPRSHTSLPVVCTSYYAIVQCTAYYLFFDAMARPKIVLLKVGRPAEAKMEWTSVVRGSGGGGVGGAAIDFIQYQMQ